MKKSSPGSTQLPTSRHLLSPSQPLIVTSVTYIHTRINRLWSPLAYGLGGNNVMLKNTPACHFWPVFLYKTVNNFWTKKKISKIANKVLEKRQRRGSVLNFKTRALVVWTLKGKQNCENEHRETASFMCNFVQKTNATVQLWWHFIPTSPLIFFTRFSPEDPF